MAQGHHHFEIRAEAVMAPKQRLDLVSIAQLEQLTGKHFKTIKRKLVGLNPVKTEGSSILFEAKLALPMIYGVVGEDADSGERKPLDLTQERARLAKAQAEKAELDLKVAKQELFPAALVEKEWSSILSNIRARIRSIPAKIAPRLASISDPRIVENELILETDEALIELSNDQYHDDRDEEDAEEDAEAPKTSAESDGESVG